jgi:hypothetical protein
MYRLFGLTIFGIVSTVLIASGAQEPGPAKTTPVPGIFKMFLVWDKRYDEKDERNREGKLHDPVDEHGLFTVVAVFSRHLPKEMEDPLYAVMAKQEQLATTYKIRRLGVFVGFLALERDYQDDETREPLTRQVNDLGVAGKYKQLALGFAQATKVPEGAEPESKENLEPATQVTNWGIKGEDDITIVVYHRFNIIKRMAFKKDAPPTAEDLKAVSDTVDELMKRK